MQKIQEKNVICKMHELLLFLILRYGNGAITLPQLRALALVLGLYSNAQAVNRAVRELRDADVLERQTWVDNNSDLLLARKFALRYFSGKSSQEVATPQRPRTMAPYVQQSRKIDWLLSIMDKYHLTTTQGLNTFLRACGCTAFLRLPELPAYYRDYARILAAANPENYREQLARMEDNTPDKAPVITLEQMHRRGIYINRIDPKKRAVWLLSFPGRDVQPGKVMDWTIDACQWLISLLPYYHIYHYLQALDKEHQEALKAALLAIAPDTQATPYWLYRLEGAHLAGTVQIAVSNSDFIKNWCGNIRHVNQ